MADELSRLDCAQVLLRARELGMPARRVRFDSRDELWPELTGLIGVGASGK